MKDIKVDINGEELLKLVDAILHGYCLGEEYIEYCQFCMNELSYPHDLSQHTEGCVVHLATEIKECFK